MSQDKNNTPDTPEEEQPYEGILGDYEESKETEAPVLSDLTESEKKEKKGGNKKALTIAGISASVVLLGCLGFIGVKQFNANKPKPAVSTENMEVSKQVLTCYYWDIINSYIEYYGEEALLSYYQLDVNQPLQDQAYPVGDGTTWHYQILEQAKQTVSQQLQVAEAAKAAGYTLSEEQLQEIEEEVAATDISRYGNGVTEDDLRDMLRLQTYSIAYHEEYVYSLSYTDEEIEAYYADHEMEYQTCTLACFPVTYVEEETSEDEDASLEEEAPEAGDEEAEVEGDESDAEGDDAEAEEETSETEEDTDAEDEASETEEDTDAEDEASETEEDADDADEETDDTDKDAEEDVVITKEIAEELVANLTAAKTAQAFEKQVSEILTTYEGYTEEELESLLPSLYNSGYGYTAGDELSEWAFGGAKVGDTYTIEYETTTYVYMLTSEPGLDNSETINVRHILFATSEHIGEDGDEAAALDECRTLAQNCLTEWQTGEMTEDSFADLATAYTEDPGSQSTGGLYEHVYEGQMVQAFNDWCFDPSRQAGDTGIVETNYGIHVMYFVDHAGPMWKAEVSNALMQQEYEAWFADLEAAYPVTFDDEVINTIEG